MLLVFDLESVAELNVELTDAPGLPMEEVFEFDGFIERLEIEGNDGAGRMSCGGLQKGFVLCFLLFVKGIKKILRSSQ